MKIDCPELKYVGCRLTSPSKLQLLLEVGGVHLRNRLKAHFDMKLKLWRGSRAAHRLPRVEVCRKQALFSSNTSTSP